MRVSLRLFLLLLIAAVLPAEQWLETSTDRFRFVYREEYEFAVQELVGFADEVFEEVATLFDSDPAEVTAVVYGETDLANGYYNPNPPQHIGLFVVQPSTEWIGSETESWLRLLLVHELTHFLQANHHPGLFESLATLFGSSIAGLDIGLVPLWLTEGLSIHSESTRTSGGRQADPRYELYERALILEGRMFSLEQAGYASHLAPPGRQYVAGGFLVEYMVDEFGEEFVASFIDDFSSFPLFGMWGPIRRVTGLPMTEIYSDAIQWLQQRYADQQSEPTGVRITPEQRSDYYLPVDTPLGWYLYRTRPDRRPGIVVRSGNGTEAQIVSAALSDPFSWDVTADGQKLVFATVSVDRNEAGDAPLRSNLYLHDVSLDRTEAITKSGGFFQPRISPEGDFLVAVRRYSGYHELVRVDLAPDIAEPQPLRSVPAARYYNPAFSPSGRFVVVSENIRGTQRLILIETETGDARPLPSPDGTNASFARFVTERRVLFTASVNNSLRLFELDLTSDSITEIGRDRVGIFEATEIDDQVIYRTYTADGSALKLLRQSETRVALPVFQSVPEATPAPLPVSGNAFLPVAWPRYWIPTVGFSGGVLDLPFLGAGAIVAGRGLLGRTGWVTQALYYPALTQIGYNFTFQTDLGALLLSAFAESEYGILGRSTGAIYSQRFSQGLLATYDLINDYELGVSRRVGLTAESSTRYAFASLAPFGIHELGAAHVADLVPLFVPAVGVIAARSPISALDAAAPPWGIGIRANGALPISLTDGTVETLFVAANGFINLGVGGSHVVSVRPELTYATNSSYASPFSLRGFSGSTVTTSDGPGHFKLALSYLPPHFLVDIPLFSSVGITRFGLSAFAELTGGFTAEPVAIGVDEAVAAGVAFTTVVRYLVDWPITAGVSLRLRPGEWVPSGFDDVSLFFDLNISESLAIIDSTLPSRDETTFHDYHTDRTRLPWSCCQ